MYSLGLGVGFTSRQCSQCLIMGAGAGKDCGGDVGTGAFKNEGNFADNTVSLLNVCFFAQVYLGVSIGGSFLNMCRAFER